MTMHLLSLTCLLLLGSTAASLADPAPATQSATQPVYHPRLDKDGWEILFNGKDLDAWQTTNPPGIWAIDEQGELYPAKKGPSLYTQRRYCDFVIELDFKVAADRKSNSGVFLHYHSTKDLSNARMEVQILDNASYGVKWDAMNANGALYDLVHPMLDANKPLGEWNHYRISVNGAVVSIELNGKAIVAANIDQWTTAHQNPDGQHNKFPYAIADLPREGFIGLQNYGGAPVWFRNIRLQPLSDRQPKYTGNEPVTQVLARPELK